VNRTPLTLLLILGLAGLALAAPGLLPQPDDRGPFRTTAAQDGEPLGVGRIVPDLLLRPLEGDEQRLSALLKERRAVVLCMTSATCPLSIKYGPRLTAMAEEYAPRGVHFVLVNVADTDTPRDMQRQARSLRWTGPYLPDRDRAIRAALAPRTTTEVFVIDRGRTLRYRGAVDDQHGIGTSLPHPRHEYLRDALESLLAGRDPAIGATWPPGCVVAPEPGVLAPPAEVTYHNRISRIIQDRCLDCHSIGRAAPFDLGTYEAVAGRAAMIEAVVREGIMPPWHAAPPEPGAPSPWRNDGLLTASERADLLAWLRAGLPVGDPADAPAPRDISPGWALGTPDLILMPPSLAVPADGPMVYGPQRVDTGLREDAWVSAIELLPRKRDTVHHALVYVVPPETGDARLLAVYGPGYSTVEFPPDAAAKIPAGSWLLVHLYAQPMGQRHGAGLRVGLHFADAPPAREVRTTAAVAEDLAIPPRVPRHAVTASVELEEETTILAFLPCLRARARAVSYEAILPGGEEVLLLDVPRYDFKWRPRYELAEPVTLPRGTMIRCRAVFDNSPSNPNNPDPDAEVHAGWSASDEMLLGAFEYLARPE